MAMLLLASLLMLAFFLVDLELFFRLNQVSEKTNIESLQIV
jgi:hypothetical protein